MEDKTSCNGFSKIVFALLILVPLFFPLVCHAAALQIVFFNPGEPEDTFWRPVEDFMRAACQDLGMVLKVYYADRNQRLMLQQFETVAADADKPDAVVFQSLKHNGIPMLQIAEKARIPAFVFNATLSEAEKTIHGGPREKFAFWLGEMVPDDRYAGAELCRQLYGMAVEQGLLTQSGKLPMLAINGSRTDAAAVEREKGLMDACAKNAAIDLKPVVFANWKQLDAQAVYARSMRAYPDVKAVWAANDSMALGAIDAMRKLGITPLMGQVAGGIDWTLEALTSIRKGALNISMGGHFMEGGWVMVMLYDYFSGIDFAAGGVAYKSKMSAITPQNVDTFLNTFGTGNWGQIDFTQFSKKYTPQLTAYEFGLDAILKQFE